MSLSNFEPLLQESMMNSPYKALTRICVIGDSGVGKSSLVNRLTSGKFFSSYSMTIGGDFKVKKIPTDHGRIHTFIFTDLSGQSRFEVTRKAFYSSCDLVFAVCDVTRKDSLTNLIKTWIPEFIKLTSNHNNFKPKIQIIGNKSDLTDYTVISLSDLEEIALKVSLKFPHINVVHPCLMTSAKNNFCYSN
jgi:small GTP-binding protein